MKSKILAIPMAMSLLAGSITASAHNYQGRQNSSHGWQNGYAKVTQVTPKYMSYVRYERRDMCDNDYGYTQPHDYSNDNYYTYDENKRDNSTRNGIIGAVIGGAIGNQFGDGKGKTAATIGGAAIGATVGANHDKDQYRQRGAYSNDVNYRHRDGANCHSVEVPVTYQRLSGYDVGYRYRGERGRMFTTSYPEQGYIKIR